MTMKGAIVLTVIANGDVIKNCVWEKDADGPQFKDEVYHHAHDFGLRTKEELEYLLKYGRWSGNKGIIEIYLSRGM